MTLFAGTIQCLEKKLKAPQPAAGYNRQKQVKLSNYSVNLDPKWGLGQTLSETDKL